MNNAARSLLRHSLIIVAASTVAACAGDASLGPTSPAQLTTPAVAPHEDIAGVDLASGRKHRAVDLGTCTNLRAPAGATLISHVYAAGDQIYRWNGTSWVFVAPSAILSADAGGHSTVGTHYAGPTWESNSGSKVVGTVLDRCTVSTAAIPWLSLTVVSSNGPGIFDGVTFIQRVNTVGGTAPAAAGTFVGETVNVPYTADYYFYR